MVSIVTVGDEDVWDIWVQSDEADSTQNSPWQRARASVCAQTFLKPKNIEEAETGGGWTLGRRDVNGDRGVRGQRSADRGLTAAG